MAAKGGFYIKAKTSRHTGKIENNKLDPPTDTEGCGIFNTKARRHQGDGFSLKLKMGYREGV
jgi:hypothetical protein